MFVRNQHVGIGLDEPFEPSNNQVAWAVCSPEETCNFCSFWNLLFVHTTLPFLKTKMISLWSNLHQEKNWWKKSVNLEQYAVFLHRYEEERYLQTGKTRLPNWNKKWQEPRVSDQKTSRVRAKIQMVKLSRKLSTSCWMSATWRTFIWSITTCLLHSSRREQLAWTFLERFMTFTSMWWRPVHLAIQQNREAKDDAWADYGQKKLEVSSFCNMDLQKLGDKTFWISNYYGWSHITHNSISA